MKRLIAFISILMLASVVMAASGTVRIWGTNKDNANQNTSVLDAPQNITVRAFDGNTTTFSSTVNNASDDLTFSIANQTKGRVLELRVNGTVVNGYQVNSTGWVSFTRTQLTGNQTYKLTPAINIGGYNFTWSWFGTVVGAASSGSYAGDDTVNRAIPHRLMRKPNTVLISRSGDQEGLLWRFIQPGYIDHLSDVAQGKWNVTTWDVNNFYVGNVSNNGQSGNQAITSVSYYWVAW